MVSQIGNVTFTPFIQSEVSQVQPGVSQESFPESFKIPPTIEEYKAFWEARIGKYKDEIAKKLASQHLKHIVKVYQEYLQSLRSRLNPMELERENIGLGVDLHLRMIDFEMHLATYENAKFEMDKINENFRKIVITQKVDFFAADIDLGIISSAPAPSDGPQATKEGSTGHEEAAKKFAKHVVKKEKVAPAETNARKSSNTTNHVQNKISGHRTERNAEADSFCFPSEDAIVGYLTKHPIANYQYVKEKKIIQTIAKELANQCRTSDAVRIKVFGCISDMLGKSASHIAGLTLEDLFVTALKDCAKGKPIEQAKK